MAGKSHGTAPVHAWGPASAARLHPAPAWKRVCGRPDERGQLMTQSAFIGMILKRGQQRYECVAIQPYQRANGKMTSLAVWRTNCPQCDQVFEVICGMSMTRGPLNRRCLPHRAPGKRVEQSMRRTSRQKRVSCERPEASCSVTSAVGSSLLDDHQTAPSEGGAVLAFRDHGAQARAVYQMVEENTDGPHPVMGTRQ